LNNAGHSKKKKIFFFVCISTTSQECASKDFRTKFDIDFTTKEQPSTDSSYQGSLCRRAENTIAEDI